MSSGHLYVPSTSYGGKGRKGLREPCTCVCVRSGYHSRKGGQTGPPEQLAFAGHTPGTVFSRTKENRKGLSGFREKGGDEGE